MLDKVYLGLSKFLTEFSTNEINALCSTANASQDLKMLFCIIQPWRFSRAILVFIVLVQNLPLSCMSAVKK